MKLLSLIIVALMLQCQVSAQTFSLSISHRTSEKSKDSYTTTETFNINGTAVAYALKYTGRRGGGAHDTATACTFTSEQITKIKQTITDKHLNLTDSLISTLTGMSSVTINIAVTQDNKETKIKIRGSAKDLTGKPLYKNSMSLIFSIRKMLEDCQ